jgi:aspartyl/asparaginyl beta-hydroxylase (cupin superfamily)
MTDPMKFAAMADEAARALWAGDAQTAAGLYKTLVAHQPKTANHWLNLAQAEARRGSSDAALAALNQALAIEPRLLPALLLKAVNLGERGDVHGAGDMYQAALAVAPPFEQAPLELRPLIRRAQAALGRLQAAREAFFRDHLEEVYRDLAGAKTDRFAQSVEVLLGKKSIYRQQPHNFYFPGLPETQFYDRASFDWLEEVEASTGVFRAEFEAVWRDDHGFSPYIDYPPGAPVDQWTELNHSPRWSAFHILRNGAAVAENAARCPGTLAALAAVPAPGLVNRSPNAMFSLLQPRTRIPPHTGETNVRLVVHVPLIVPEQTGFRVGNDTRPWRVGEAFVFNDTIEHEAWNDSDQIRVVLIFDIWHPGLSADERELVARLMALRDEFRGQSGPGLGL